jgi:hypothetical protein
VLIGGEIAAVEMGNFPVRREFTGKSSNAGADMLPVVSLVSKFLVVLD